MNTATATQDVPELDGVDDLDPECFETFEDVKEELAGIELELAARFKIHRHVRRALLVLDRTNKLEEDDLVVRWQRLYSRYIAWARFDTWEEPPCASEDNDKGAAVAALAVFVGIDWVDYGAQSQTGAISGALLPGIGSGSEAAWTRRVHGRIALVPRSVQEIRRDLIESHI